MSPWLLPVLTFALSAGDAFETPTWRAVLPEMVKKDDLAAASALNGIEFNFARAVGPALRARTRGQVAGRDNRREAMESLADAGHRQRPSART
jgi:hypothetical protein